MSDSRSTATLQRLYEKIAGNGIQVFGDHRLSMEEERLIKECVHKCALSETSFLDAATRSGPTAEEAAQALRSAGEAPSMDRAVRDAYRSALTYAASICDAKVFDRENAFDNGCWSCGEAIRQELNAINRDNPGELPRSSAAVAPVAWRYYLSENTGPTFTANADDPFVKAMRATPLYEQPSALPAEAEKIAKLEAMVKRERECWEASERRAIAAEKALQSASEAPSRDDIIEECALLCEGFQIHYSQLGYAENERTAWTLAGQIREMKTGGRRA